MNTPNIEKKEISIPAHYELEFSSADPKANIFNMIEKACRTEDIGLMSKLLKNGVDVNIQDIKYKHGETPLIMAVKAFKPKMVEFLLDKGAVLHSIDNFGYNAMYYACKAPFPLEHDIETLKVLLKHKANTNIFIDGIDVLLWNISKKKQNIACALIEEIDPNGSQINPKDKRKQIPLLQAVKNKELKIIECLLTNGSNVNATDKNKSSALAYNVMEHIRISGREYRAIKINSGLSGKGADKAVSQDLELNIKIAKTLIDNGIDGNIKNIRGQSALDIAKNNNIEYIEQYYNEAKINKMIFQAIDNSFSI